MNKIIKLIGLLATMLLGLSVSPAFASDWVVDVHVTSIEVSYLPQTLNFAIDAPAGACATGARLYLNIKGADQAAQNANVTGIYTALVTALTTGRELKLVGNNAGCTVDFVYIE